MFTIWVLSEGGAGTASMCVEVRGQHSVLFYLSVGSGG